jgi:hypothetical protein
MELARKDRAKMQTIIYFAPNALRIESVHIDETQAPRILDIIDRFGVRDARIT